MRVCEPAADVGSLIDLLASGSGTFDVDGPDADPVDQLDHHLQTAALLDGAAPSDPELVAAGLVHDLGHQLAPGCLDAHGEVAADHVRALLGDRVARLVALHVPAKRYLVTAEAGYAATLSRGSTRSLALQGGGLADDERARLDADPLLADALTLRRADDAAKVVGATVPGLAHWRPLLEALAARVGR